MTDDERLRARARIADLEEQRARLLASLASEADVGDRVDQADVTARRAELARINQMIADLAAHPDHAGPAARSGAAGAAPIGTRATLEYPSGSVETVEIGYAAREEEQGEGNGGGRLTVVTAQSPIAKVLAEARAGSVISWSAPGGTTTARVLELSRP